MAKFTPNAIYTYIRGKILESYPSMYVTSTYEPIPPQDTAVRIHELNHYRPRRNITLSNDDEQWHVGFQADVYSNNFQEHDEEAYEIMRVVEDAFREIFFIETACTPVERVNNRVARLTARFEKVVGSGSPMPED